ncbi:MAG: transglycosylase SLT domain-containing protein [Caldilinea sp.]
MQRLSVELTDWQVWDIDGAVLDPDEPVDEAPHIPDRQDEVVVATLPQRRWQVEPGGAVTLPVTVLNNSAQRLAVRAYLEGWLDDRWVAEPYIQANLTPGERRTLELTFAPPRHASVEAGDYHVAVVVRSLDEPTRIARLGVVLTILPFDQIALDPSEFPESPATWWRRTLTLPLRVANEGNRSLSLHLEGMTASEVGCLMVAGREHGHESPFSLQPGERIRLPMCIKMRRLPLIALHSRSLPFVLRAKASEDGRILQQLRSAIEVQPIIGAWQLASLLGLAMIGAMATVLIVVLGALFLRISAGEERPSVLVQSPAPAIIIVTLNQPVAALPNAIGSVDDAERATIVGDPARAGIGQPDPALPLVLPDQITAPGSGGPVRSVVRPPTGTAADDASVASSTTRPMTYAQMFQTIGVQYDLDWRMLAAQAYIESGFDSLALSSAGAMGLMQVLPGTWREWAPVVGASDPFDSYSNVQVAAIYLDYLRSQLARRGYTEKEWTLVAYHWGIDRLNNFLAEGGSWQDLPEVRRRYAEDILRIAQTLP